MLNDRRTKNKKKKPKMTKKLISAKISKSSKKHIRSSFIATSKTMVVLNNDIASVGSFTPFVSKIDW